jgi:integrative and conjugative element protein (TIGR02256 family)
VKFITQNKIFSLELGDGPLKTLNKLCKQSGDIETGGVLIGYYTEDSITAVVTEVTGPPKDSKRGHSWFVRGFDGLKALLARRWKQPTKQHYLGEWHYHPAVHVEPSEEDRQQLIKIAQDSAYACKEPLMIIAGQSSGSSARPLRVFICTDEKTVDELLC